MNRKRIMILTAAILIAVLAISIAAYYYIDQSQYQREKQETVVIGTTGAVDYLDPDKIISGVSTTLAIGIYDTLYRYKNNSDELAPCLAADWPSVSEDGLVWTIPLREGIEFHDGTPFNASCVTYKLDRATRMNAPLSYLIDNYVEKCEVIDESTVRITLKTQYTPFLSILVTQPFMIVSPTAAEKYGDDEFNFHPIGTGPFRFVEWTKDVRVVLERNDDYFGSKAKSRKVIYQLYADSSTLKMALEKGEVDVTDRYILPTDVPTLKANADIKCYEAPSSNPIYLALNTKLEPLNNTLVRKAIAYGIDYAGVTHKVYHDLYQRTCSLIPPPFIGYSDSWDIYNYNVTRAQELLEEAGYADGIDIEIWYPTEQYGTEIAEVVTVMAESLAEANIRATPKYAEWTTYSADAKKGLYQVSFGRCTPDYFDPDIFTGFLFHSTGLYAIKRVYYNNTIVDDLLEQAVAIFDKEDRQQLYEQAQDIIADDCVYLVYVQLMEQRFCRKNVEGVFLPGHMFMDLHTMYKTSP